MCTAQLDELIDRLGYEFRNRDLLVQALTHSSYSHEMRTGELNNYERLEFLGDALLGFLVSHWFWKQDGDASEGILTRRKQMVVSMQALAGIASDLRIGEHLLLGRGEVMSGGGTKISILADVFEALLAAVYLDGGIRAARSFMVRHMGNVLTNASDSRLVREDYKTKLQEAMQARHRSTPTYRIAGATGPDHERVFRAEVLIMGEVVASGTGTSRKQAEQMAAKEALGITDQSEWK